MGYTLALKKNEQISLSVTDADKLFRAGNGDAALLYLYLLRQEGKAGIEEVRKELHFSDERRAMAEKILSDIGLLGEIQTVSEPSPESKPEYTQTDIAEALERDAAYAKLEKAVAAELHKPALTTNESRMLYGIYDYLSMPVDVIFLLVRHCIERSERNYGIGRRPTVRQIEKEAYFWHQKHLLDSGSADQYLRKYNERQGVYPRYMSILQLGERAPAPGEEKYLEEWAEMGFSPEAVAIAYDKTMLKCHELRWAYLTGILRRWHRDGIHTPEEIRQGDTPKAKKTTAATQTTQEEEMLAYVRKLYKED